MTFLTVVVMGWPFDFSFPFSFLSLFSVLMTPPRPQTSSCGLEGQSQGQSLETWNIARCLNKNFPGI